MAALNCQNSQPEANHSVRTKCLVSGQKVNLVWLELHARVGAPGPSQAHLGQDLGPIPEAERCGHPCWPCWEQAEPSPKGTGCEGQTDAPPGSLAADTWPRQTQTPGPGATKDQQVSGRPADRQLRGSLATLISDLTDCLHHLLPLVTDKAKPQAAGAGFT